jgi:hypothetical protein
MCKRIMKRDSSDVGCTSFSHLRDQKLNFLKKKRRTATIRDKYFIDELRKSKYFIKGCIINMKILTTP